MKKLINGKQVNIPIEFFSDFLLGQQLNKITLSNVYDVDKSINKKADACIQTYKSIFMNLHPILRYVESNLKYGLIGEIIGKPYFVKNLTLEIPLDDNYSCYFKGENWSYGTAKKIGKKFKDYEDYSSYKIYENYLKKGKDNWFANSFPELWDAIDQNEDKLEGVLPEICSFISTSMIEVNTNEIYDLDLKVKYTIIPEFNTNTTKNRTVLMVENTIKPVKDNFVYDFKVFKQSLIESSSGKKDYGAINQVNNFYPEVWEKIDTMNKKELKGIILNQTLYFEIENDIYRALNGKVEKLIQNAKLYGNKMKSLLFYHDTKYSDTIIKRVIYILKDNSYDIAKVEFLGVNDV